MPSGSSKIQDFLPPFEIELATRTSVMRGGRLTMFSVVLQGAMRLFTSVSVGRLGGPASLGVFQSAVSTAQLLCLLWPTTTASATSKFVARARGKGDLVEAGLVASHLLRRSLQAASVLAIAAFPVWLLIDGGTAQGAVCIALLVMSLAGYNFARGLQFGAGRIERAAFWDVIAAVLGATAVLAALLGGVRGLSLLLPLAASYSIFTIAAFPKGLSVRKIAIHPYLRREIDGFIVLGVAGTLASAGFLQVSMVLARATGDDANAGQYAAAFTLATPAAIVASSIGLALFPSMAEAWGRGDLKSYVRQTHRATSLLLVSMVAIIGSLTIFSPNVIRAFWGNEFDTAAQLLPLLLLAVLMTSIAVPSVNSLTSRNQRGMITSAVSSTVGMLVGIAVWVFAVPLGGNVGIAIGYLAGSAVSAAVPIAIVWRSDRHRWGRLGSQFAMAVAMMTGGRALLHSLGDPWELEVLVWLAFMSLWWLLTRADIRRLRSP